MRNGSRNGTANLKDRRTERTPVEVGSGNVYADLGFANPELWQAKALVVNQIEDVIADRRLTHARAAEMLGLEPEKLKDLLRGRMRHFSLDRLFRFLNKLGTHVEIVIRTDRAPDPLATLSVVKSKPLTSPAGTAPRRR